MINQVDKLYALTEKLINELVEYTDRNTMSRDDAETIKYLASGADHICNIIDKMEAGQIYMPMSAYADKSYRKSMRGYSGKRDGMGRYARDGFAEQLEQLMNEAPNEQVRNKLQTMLDQM